MLQATLDDLRADQERLTNLIKINFVGRLVRPKTIPDLIFEVQSYDPNSSELLMRRLKDPNGILLNQTNSYGANFKRIRGSLLKKFYDVIDIDEEHDMRKVAIQSSQLVIKYQVMEVEGKFECAVTSVKPKKIDMDDYEIRLNDDGTSIKSVMNKAMGEVEFTGVQVDHEGVIMGMNIQVFTNVTKVERKDGEDSHELDVLNILHINFNDTNDETRVDIVYIEDG